MVNIQSFMERRTARPTIALDSLGCKLNRAEIEAIAIQLEASGYRLVSPGDKADIYILNTCTVTHVADRKTRHWLRQAHRRNPDARLIAIGCYAHRAPGELDRIEGVELVLGNDRKADLVSLLENNRGLIPAAGGTPLSNEVYSRRTRAFLKIQDGCRNYCAFCIVPYVRTREECRPADNIIAQINERVSAGFKEVVLTGTEIGTYSSDGLNLAGLLEHILKETDIKRLRLSSLQPMEITESFIRLWRDSRLCPHFHLSLQSGSDTVLGRMKRRYDTAGYRRAVGLIREAVPDVAITTDVIVGFPGETDKEYNETLQFCREMGFSRIHVFPFSPRPGTAAADMPEPVPAAVKKARNQQMLSLARESITGFQQRLLDKTMEVLWEQKVGGTWSGLTGNYTKVYTKCADNLTNQLLPVRLVRPYKDGLWGNVL
jgi:threonylcarbamoyladenosine tRNA methylthiotransferase MtaB